jgi:hypothetical protein
MDSVEFYRTRKTLISGTYQITEHDGEINYAVVDRYSNVKWYSQREYDLAIEQGIHDQDQDARLDAIMMFDDDLDQQLMDSWDIAMHRQDDTRKADEIAMADHDEFRRVDAHDFANDDDRVDTAVDAFDERALDNDLDANRVPGKTLGELLRESMMTSPLVTESGGYQVGTQEDHDAFMAKRNASMGVDAIDDGYGFEVEHEEDIVSGSEFEQHKADLTQFIQTSSEQLDRSMANKPADLGDLL